MIPGPKTADSGDTGAVAAMPVVELAGAVTPQPRDLHQRRRHVRRV